MATVVPHLQRGHLVRFLESQRISERQLVELLRLASQDAFERLAAVAGREGIGAKVRTAQLTVARAQMGEVIDSMMFGSRSVEQAIRDGITRATSAGAASSNLINEVMFTGLGDYPGLKEATIVQARRGIDNLISRGMNDVPFSQQVYRTGALAKDQLHRFLNSSIAAGSTWREVAAGARRFISPTVPGGVSSAAKRLARTELNNAFHTTQIRTSVRSPFVIGYRWMLSGSHPRPDQCNAYAFEDHAGLGPGVFLKGDVPGKPHPNCLCYLMYVTPTVEEFQRKFLEGDYDQYLDDYIEEFAPHLKSRATAARKATKAETPKPQPNRPINNIQADRSGSHWQRMIRQETGETNGIPFRSVGITRGPQGGRGYVAKAGRIYRVDGLDVLIEVPKGIIADGYAERILQDILRLWRSMPVERQKWLKKVEWVEGRNPMDFEWEKRYKRKGFRSAAHAGHENMVFWDRAVTKSATELEGTFQHEFGHIIDNHIGRLSISTEWESAMIADAEANAAFKGGSYIGGRFTILTGNKAGNTSYGKSAVGEDFAEAVQLFLEAQGNKNQVQYLFQGKLLTYQEMFPNRYKILSRYLGAM